MYLYLPIEIKNREFHAKLLLACFAARQGFTVLIGEQNEISFLSPWFPRGVVLDKGVAPVNVRYLKRYSDLGYCNTAWCEEGLVFRNREAYLKERISTEAFSLVNLFFGWGGYQTELIREKIAADEKIVLTGNPRFDLLRRPYREIFRQDAEKIRQEYGPFILINTNFSRFNHFNGRDYVIELLKARGRIKNQSEERFFVEWADFLGVIFNHFLDVIPILSRTFPDHTLVVRPHPSEKFEVWEDEMRNLPNVRVVCGGNVIPWIMAGEVVIHNSCNTGVESYLLERPVVAYVPAESKVYDSMLPNGVGMQAETPEQLVAVLRKVIRDPESEIMKMAKDPEARALANRFIANLEGPVSSQLVVDALVDLAKKIDLAEDQSSLLQTIAAGKRFIMGSAKSLFIRARKVKKKWRKAYNYQESKFPGLTLTEVEQALALFSSVDSKMASVRAVKASGTRNCYWVSERAK